MKIRRFNGEGIRAFQTFISICQQSRAIDKSALNSLLVNDSLSSAIESQVSIPKDFKITKFDIAKMLSELLELRKNPELYYDRGLWSWLGAFFLEALVLNKKGSTEPDFREISLYVLESKWTKYYRHLLAFPCWTYSELQEKGKIFLRGPISERGEVVEQLSAVNDIQRNTNIIEAATLLYYDKKKDDIVRGAASKNQGGTVRRFRDVIQQLKVTYDLNAMTGSQIIGVLPAEFARWQKAG